MTTYALFLENVPEPPPPRSHNPGRFVPLFEHARRANGGVDCNQSAGRNAT